MREIHKCMHRNTLNCYICKTNNKQTCGEVHAIGRAVVDLLLDSNIIIYTDVHPLFRTMRRTVQSNRNCMRCGCCYITTKCWCFLPVNHFSWFKMLKRISNIPLHSTHYVKWQFESKKYEMDNLRWNINLLLHFMLHLIWNVT